MVSSKHWVLSVLVVLLLLTPASAYKGSQLSRGPVESFSLIDQNGENYSFDTDSEGVIVISFMFTRCPDVCPVITQQLKSVELELSQREREDVTFLSISVDPAYDSPEVLLEYTQRQGVSWPHLTGTLEELEPVWEAFALVVQANVIEAHVMDYQPGEASVTLVNTNNTSSQHMFVYDGWTATSLVAEQAGWSLNASDGMLIGINGTDSPADWSWYWELNLWNATSDAWEASMVGMNDVDVLETPHIAWMNSNTNRSLLPEPDMDLASSVTVQWSNNSSEVVGLDHFTAYHITEGAFMSAGINTTNEPGSYGHYMTDINNQTAPDDFSWWWNLYAWNETNETWESSNVGQDDFAEPTHIAWAPSTVDEAAIPSPMKDDSENVCNGHGWVMGSGSNAHCMCDAGYGWDDGDRLTCVPETTEDYTVGHSTITYILNSKREPVVAWTGDSWKVSDFAADIRELLENEQLGGYETEITPSLSFLLTGMGLMAAVAFGRRESSEHDDEAKAAKTEAPPLT